MWKRLFNCYGDNCIEGLLSEEKPSIISLSEFHTKQGRDETCRRKNTICARKKWYVLVLFESTGVKILLNKPSVCQTLPVLDFWKQTNQIFCNSIRKDEDSTCLSALQWGVSVLLLVCRWFAGWGTIEEKRHLLSLSTFDLGQVLCMCVSKHPGQQCIQGTKTCYASACYN